MQENSSIEGLPTNPLPVDASARWFDELVLRCQRGCKVAEATLADQVHDDFYRIAVRLCGGHLFENSMHATQLVNEAFLRLLKAGVFRKVHSQAHLFAFAGRTMRNVIADYFRRRQAEKRPTSRTRCYLDEIVDQLATQPFEYHDLNTALDRLEEMDPRQAQIVNMRFFLGMTVPETARALEISPSTVEKEWKKARITLFEMLN
ncbi:MAG: ECF-type sigma factor [Pirellulaceae bacterium]